MNHLSSQLPVLRPFAKVIAAYIMSTSADSLAAADACRAAVARGAAPDILDAGMAPLQTCRRSPIPLDIAPSRQRMHSTQGVRAQTAIRPLAHVPAKDVRRTRREVAQRHENGASGASVQGGGQHSGGDRRFDGRGSNCGATMESVMLPPTHPRCARHYGPVENTRERSKFWSSRANPSTLVVRFATIHKPREMTSGMA